MLSGAILSGKAVWCHSLCAYFLPQQTCTGLQEAWTQGILFRFWLWFSEFLFQKHVFQVFMNSNANSVWRCFSTLQREQEPLVSVAMVAV